MSTMWTDMEALDRWCSTASAGRRPVIVLLGRPARRRAPTAVIWQLLTYDRRTRTPVEEIARRWEPTGPLRPAVLQPDPGPDPAVPEPVLLWVTSILGSGVTIAGPADDLAGPPSWHINPAILAADPADPAGAQVQR